MKLWITLCLLYLCAEYITAGMYMYTTLYTLSRSSCQPEFTAVSFVNERMISSYNSKNQTLTPAQPWVRDVLSNYSWDMYKETHLSEYKRLQKELNATMERLGHKDVYTFQRMFGCEWDDETNHVKGFDEYGYNGEDFISLNTTEKKYIPHRVEAHSSAERWNSEETIDDTKFQQCANWLRRFGKKNLVQTGNITFYQKTPSSPVVCQVTGFCPSAMRIFLRKNGTEMKNVSTGAVLPDGDGKYLRKISFIISQLDPSQFTCVAGEYFKDLDKKSLKHSSDDSKFWIWIIIIIVSLIMTGVILFGVSRCCCKKPFGSLCCKRPSYSVTYSATSNSCTFE